MQNALTEFFVRNDGIRPDHKTILNALRDIRLAEEEDRILDTGARVAQRMGDHEDADTLASVAANLTKYREYIRLECLSNARVIPWLRERHPLAFQPIGP